MAVGAAIQAELQKELQRYGESIRLDFQRIAYCWEPQRVDWRNCPKEYLSIFNRILNNMQLGM